MNSVAIIGGGITGLTAAFRMQQQGLPVTVYEASSRPGGVIQSVRQNGYLAEYGPNSLLETSPKIGALIRDAGLESRRLYSLPEAENRYLVRYGRTIALPKNPLRIFVSPLFSIRAKLALLMEPLGRRAPANVEESVEQFVLRRLGREFLDYAINPLVSGIYAGDPARLSVPHAFPKLHALEQRYGSLILGQILGARARKKSGEVSKQEAKKVSFDDGLQVLTDTLAARLGPAMLLDAPVLRIEETPQGWEIVARRNGQPVRGKHSAVLYTGTAHALSTIEVRCQHAPDLSPLAQVYYPPVASIVLGFRRQDVAHPLDGFGVLIPKVEKFSILGTLFSSSLFPGRAPENHVTLTSYVGGVRHPELALHSADELINLTVQDLRRLLGIGGQPTFRHHRLYRRAIPQYEVGYGYYKKLMDDVEAKASGFFLAGHFRNGISLGDSIIAGLDVAGRVAAFAKR